MEFEFVVVLPEPLALDPALRPQAPRAEVTLTGRVDVDVQLRFQLHGVLTWIRVRHVVQPEGTEKTDTAGDQGEREGEGTEHKTRMSHPPLPGISSPGERSDATLCNGRKEITKDVLYRKSRREHE